MKKRILFFSPILCVLLSFIFFNTFAEQPIQIYVNQSLLQLDVEPVIVDSRTMVPFRAIFEAVGAKVSWNSETQTASGIKDNTEIQLTINQNVGVVNNIPTPLDASPIILNGRTMVPVRFVSENMGFNVLWDGSTRTIYLDNQGTNLTLDDVIAKSQDFTFYNLGIGSTLTALKNELGNPDRIDPSIYGFRWYIYNDDYANYIQVGVQNDKIVAFYTNNVHWTSKSGLHVGSTKTEVINQLGSEIQQLTKGYYIYKSSDLDPNDEYGLYKNTPAYLRIFYDTHENNTITGIFVVQTEIEEAFVDYYGTPNEALKDAFEEQCFDLANADRVRRSLSAFDWSDRSADTARMHSEDMAENNFFAHVNLDGKEPYERGEANGISYRVYAENIAGGLPNAIYTHQAWMNSEGHRKALLSDTDYLGVGVAWGGFYNVYYTENFYTPR